MGYARSMMRGGACTTFRRAGHACDALREAAAAVLAIVSASCDPARGQDGCRWDDTCSGVAEPCSSLGVTLCEDAPGCYLVSE